MGEVFEFTVNGQVQRTDYMVLVHFEDLVHQKHRRTVRKDLHDLFFVQHIIIPLNLKSKIITAKLQFCR